MVNVKLLKKVRKLIAEEPKRLKMEVWAKKTKDKNGPACGTVACLAGWAILASTPKREWTRLFKATILPAGDEGSFCQNVGRRIDDRAAELFGIPKEWCPFWQRDWKAKKVLAWIDEQIALATPTNSSPKI